MIEQLIDMAIAKWEWAAPTFRWIGLGASTAIAAIILTPTKKDDKWLAEMKKTPIIGSIIASLIKFDITRMFKPK